MNTPERFDDEPLDWLAKPHDPIRDAQNALINGSSALFVSLPVVIKNIIRERQWQAKRAKGGRPFKSFREFVEDRGFEGLCATYEDLMWYCSRDAECTELLKAEREEPPQILAERLAADYDTAYLIGLIRCLTLRLRADTAAERTDQ